MAILPIVPVPAAAADAVAPTESSFYVDYWDRVVRQQGETWPYLGGHGDAIADLGLWKFPSDVTPAARTPAEQARLLRTIGSEALDWDRDGLDVLYLQRLFVEVVGVLDAFGAAPTWIDPRTCTPATLADDDAFPRPPWRPAGGIGAGLTSPETEELTVLGGMLCREADRRAAAELLRATEDLAGRLADLEAATAGLAGPGRLLQAEGGAAGDELVLEVGDLPPPATVLDWVEEVDRVLGQFDLRRRLRPDLAGIAAAYKREALAPASRFGTLIDCGAWVGATATFLDEDVFFDAWVDVQDGRIQVTTPSLSEVDAGLGEEAAAVIGRVAAALYVLARRSADAADVELMRQEPLQHPIPASPEVRAVLEKEFRQTGRFPDPARMQRRSWWVGNPFDLRTLWKRSVEKDVLVAEFGASFGEALAAYRDGLRRRVLEFDVEGADREQLLHAVSRLGIDRVLPQPLDGPTEGRLFPWLPAARLAELRAAWPELTASVRAEGGTALVARGAAAFGVVRDLPPEPMALFKARAVGELHRCVEPLMSPEAAAKIEPELRHARENLLDARHTALAKELERRCASGEGTAVLEEEVRLLLRRALPSPPPGQVDALVAALGLSRPCGADAAASLLRFGTFHDVLSAVFALESHAAGGEFDTPFDRDLARKVGTAPLAAIDGWLVAFREEQARARVWLRREPADEPDDRMPLLLYALPRLIPQPDDRARAQGNAPMAAWADAYRQAVAGRGYPESLAATGWLSLDDYIEEEERHRRIDATLIGTAGADGYRVRAVFGRDIPVSLLLDGDGRPAPGTESITWTRRNDGDPRYEIDIAGPGGKSTRIVLPVPPNTGRPGPRSLAEAQRFVELYWGWGG